VDSSDDNEFYDCTISDLTSGGAPTTYGVYMVSGSDENIISRAKIFKGEGPPIDDGVYMQGCSDDFILDSDIFDCLGGISIHDKSTHTISGNTIYGNKYGIYLTRTWDNIITENEIRDNREGIWLINSSNNTIERNKIVNNTGWDTGVHITEGSDGNKIHWNCFIDNVPQAWDDGHDNNWDYNFWSDYPQWGEYNISGAAGSKDHHTLRECGGSPQPAAVPALTPLGIIALVGLLSVVLAVSISIGRKR